MDEIDFVYECPRCGEEWCGSMPSDQREYSENVACEDCKKRFTVKVRVDLVISTEGR